MSNEIDLLNMHIHQVQRFRELINNLNYSGNQAKVVVELLSYFENIERQLKTQRAVKIKEEDKK